MNLLDYLVLIGSMVGIAAYGAWKTRGRESMDVYFKGDQNTRWGTIGLSVMATQASAITFLSTPGQAYESGMAFVQNYFGLPLALVIVAAVFLPLYRRLKVYTAYEFLGHRFGTPTRLLGAGLFLIQRGFAAGITIYAPAIVVSTVLHWPLDLTILLSGALVIIYTVSGGSSAVNLTQKYQMAIIMGGLATAFVVLIARMPTGMAFSDMLHVAGGLGKLQAVDFSVDPDKRYTIWSGVLGGLFLSLSYFGTDQSQVQRYLSGHSLRESRLGLMFNAVFKIPMQFLILLLGAFVFVFYQYERPPLFFNETAWRTVEVTEAGTSLRALEARQAALHAEKATRIDAWLAARKSTDTTGLASARTEMVAASTSYEALRVETRQALVAANPNIKTQDADYVFITFVLENLPHGVVGLLLAMIFAASLSSTSSELNALGTTSTVDFYRHVFRKEKSDAHYVTVSRIFTAAWGIFAVSFALFANFVENLIQAVNIVGSIFYGVVLGIFLVAFFLKRVGGASVFFAAITAQIMVIVMYFTLDISYLWYNFIGCAVCILLSVVLQSTVQKASATG